MPRGSRDRTAEMYDAPPSTELPTGIKLVASLNFVGGSLALLVVGQGLTARRATPRVEWTPRELLVPVATVAPLVALLVSTVGLIALRYWGWVGTTCVHVVACLGSLLTLNVPSAAVNAVVVYYLLGRADLYREG